MRRRQKVSKPKYSQNTGKPWTIQELNKLKELEAENTPLRVIALKLKRSVADITPKLNAKAS